MKSWILTAAVLFLSAASAAANDPPDPFVVASLVPDATPDPLPVVQRVTALEKEVAALKREVATLRGQVMYPDDRRPATKAAAAFPQKCACSQSLKVGKGTCGLSECPSTTGTGPCLCESAVTPLAKGYAVAPGVATQVPFAQASGCAGGRCMIQTTTARTAASLPYSLAPGDTLSSEPAPYQELTYTGAASIPATYGITRACANGACGVQQSARVGLFRRR